MTANISNIDHLLEIMARLRAPETGCPWDIRQTFATIAPYTIEEAYEVDDAIKRGDIDGLRDELGDLLLQVVFHARMAEEDRAFDFDAVVVAICEKMIRRHPHVFGDERIDDEAAQRVAWEEHKAAERDERADGDNPMGALDAVPLALPALLRALKLQKRAARVGFDWDDVAPVLAKVEEEITELRAELPRGMRSGRAAEEFGDLLFSLVNVARWMDIDPETALRGANAKFERRFGRVEALLDEAGTFPAEAGVEAMDRLWDLAKREEREEKGGR